MCELTYDWMGKSESRAKHANGTRLTDEEVLEAADFGLFIDLASMHQKEDGARTDAEDMCFRHALQNLNIIYAHKAMAVLLSTRLPEGVEVSRGYNDRGWCARLASVPSATQQPPR